MAMKSPQSVAKPQPSATESVVRAHLQAFVDQKGVDAIIRDYADDAHLLSGDRTYRGKPEIREFFEGFLAALSPRAVREFALKSLRCEGNIAHITWSAGRRLPLGTDTFVVCDGKIISQTFAMYVPATA
jgi:ketosteroid isomerase-like protein